MSKRFSIVAIAVTLTLALAGIGLFPQAAAAARNWHWWDAVYAQQQMPGCSGASQDDWLNKIGSQDYPHWTELTVYFIAYPCSGQPEEFMDYREWLNYEIHDVGSWDPAWANQDFYDLKNLVYELNQYPAGFWDNGPWD